MVNKPITEKEALELYSKSYDISLKQFQKFSFYLLENPNADYEACYKQATENNYERNNSR